MKSNTLKNKTTKKLKSELKAVSGITGALIAVSAVLLGVIVYALLTRSDKSIFISLVTITGFCIAILSLLLTSIKKVKAELNLRENTA